MAELIPSEYEGETNSQSAVVYNIPDLKAMAAKILRRANEVAQQKIDGARHSIAQMEQKAVDEGKVKGLEEGRKTGEQQGRVAGEEAARNEFNQKVGSVSTALQVVLKEVAAQKVALHAEAEADLLRLALEISKRIVRREVEVDDNFVVPIVREAISLTNNRSDLIVRLNPADVEAIELELPSLHAIFSDLGRVELKSDTTVERGGARVQSREGEVDMRLSEQFDALERSLVGDTRGLNIRPFSEYAPEELEAAKDAGSAQTVPSAAAIPAESVASADSLSVEEVIAAIADNSPDQVTGEVVAQAGPVQKPKPQPQPAASAPEVNPVNDASVTPGSAAADGAPEVGRSKLIKEVQPNAGAGVSALSGLSSLSDIPLDADVDSLISETLGESGMSQTSGG